MNRKLLKGIQLEHFQHPSDQTTQVALVQCAVHLKPEVQSLIANYESYLYARQISSSLWVNGDQLPDLYSLLEEACEILDMNLPLLFVENDSTINAWASGRDITFVTLTSALVEKFNRDEILAVIGHELGHIKGQHMYYNALAQNAQNILTVQAGQAAALEYSDFWLTSLIGTFQAESVMGAAAKLGNALFEWSRSAEFTADRAALLVSQDLDVTINVMAKLASGLNRNFNQKSFLKQAERFREFGAASGDFYRQMVVNQDSHPLIVLRAEELRRWASSNGYKDLTNPNQESAETRFLCARCGQEIVAPISLGGQTAQCPTCGEDLVIPGIGVPPIVQRTPPRI